MANRRLVAGAPPTPEERFYLDWARESLKKNIDLANQVLRQLVTLYASLLGGSVVFLRGELLMSPYREIVLVMFFFGLVSAFFGSMPYEGRVDIRQPQQIKRHKESALAWKRRYLWTAGSLGAAGFLVAMVGIVIG